MSTTVAQGRVYTKDELATMTRAQLQSLCKIHHLPANLKTVVLCQSLERVFQEQRLPSIAHSEEKEDEMLLQQPTASGSGTVPAPHSSSQQQTADLVKEVVELKVSLTGLRESHATTATQCGAVHVQVGEIIHSNGLLRDLVNSLQARIAALEQELRSQTNAGRQSVSTTLPSSASTRPTEAPSSMAAPRVAALLGKHPRYSDSSADGSDGSIILPASLQRSSQRDAVVVTKSPSSVNSHARKRARTVSPPSSPINELRDDDDEGGDQYNDEVAPEDPEERSFSSAGSSEEEEGQDDETSFLVPTKGTSSPPAVESRSLATMPKSPSTSTFDASFFASPRSTTTTLPPSQPTLSRRKSLPRSDLPFPLVSQSPFAPVSPFSNVGNTVRSTSLAAAHRPLKSPLRSAEMVRSSAMKMPLFSAPDTTTSSLIITKSASRPSLFQPLKTTAPPSSSSSTLASNVSFTPSRHISINKSPRKSLVFSSSSSMTFGAASTQTAPTRPPTPKASTTLYGSENRRFGDDLALS